MTRSEWYLHWREVRKARVYPSSKEIALVLKELYEIYLTGKDSVKYDLISKYEHKISERLKRDRIALKKLGEEQAKQLFNDILYKNPFLEMLPKEPDNWGGYMIVPLKIDSDKESK
jgi:hypothetical protein